jgi:hypothetical protein
MLTSYRLNFAPSANLHVVAARGGVGDDAVVEDHVDGLSPK